jgi:hypothetical protein
VRRSERFAALDSGRSIGRSVRRAGPGHQAKITDIGYDGRIILPAVDLLVSIARSTF